MEVLLIIGLVIMALVAWVGHVSAKAKEAAREAAEQHRLRMEEQQRKARSILSDTGPVPPIYSDLQLDPGEACHYMAPAGLVTLKTAITYRYTESVSFHGKLGRSISYGQRVSSTVSNSIQEWRQDDFGTIYVTSKRVIFRGHKKSASVRLNKAIHLYFHDDGSFRIDKETGAPLVVNACESIVIGAILQKLLNVGLLRASVAPGQFGTGAPSGAADRYVEPLPLRLPPGQGTSGGETAAERADGAYSRSEPARYKVLLPEGALPPARAGGAYRVKQRWAGFEPPKDGWWFATKGLAASDHGLHPATGRYFIIMSAAEARKARQNGLIIPDDDLIAA